MLRCLEEISNKIDGDVQEIIIYSDSEVVVKGLSGEYDISSENLVGIVERIDEIYSSLPTEPTFRWTKAHAGDKLNEFVDLLAYTCSTGYPYGD